MNGFEENYQCGEKEEIGYLLEKKFKIFSYFFLFWFKIKNKKGKKLIMEENYWLFLFYIQKY